MAHRSNPDPRDASQLASGDTSRGDRDHTSDRCAVDGCPGPGERVATDPCDLEHQPVWICALHDDSRVVVIEHDSYGGPHIHVDLGRVPFADTSRRGRLLRMMLEGVAAAQT